MEAGRKRSDVAVRLFLYLGLLLLASGLIAVAGYFGGELLLSGGGVP